MIEAQFGQSGFEDFVRAEIAVVALCGTVVAGRVGDGRFGTMISIGSGWGADMPTPSQWRFADSRISNASLRAEKARGLADKSLDGAIFRLAKPVRSFFWMAARLATHADLTEFSACASDALRSGL